MNEETKKILKNGFFLFVGVFAIYVFYSVIEIAFIWKFFDHDIQRGVIQKYPSYEAIKNEEHSVGGGCYFDIENDKDKKIIYVKYNELQPREKSFYVYEINKDMSYSLKEDFIFKKLFH